jgi:hypothetical protein
LWDNCHLAEVVALAPARAVDAGDAAAAIGKLARTHAADPDYDSPYVQDALQKG